MHLVHLFVFMKAWGGTIGYLKDFDLIQIFKHAGLIAPTKTNKDDLLVADLQRLMIAAHWKQNEKEKSGSQMSVRYEFVEVIVRAAKFKYIDTDMTDKYSEAIMWLFERYLDGWYRQEVSNFWGTHGWRENYLIADDVSQVIESNMELLTKLKNKYTQRPGRKLKTSDFLIEDAQMMIDDSLACLSRNEISMVF